MLFDPTLEGYVNLLTDRTRAKPKTCWPKPGRPKPGTRDRVQERGTIITGPSRYGERFLNSIIIGFGSTALCMILARWRPMRSAGSSAAEGRPSVLHPVHPDDAAHRGGDPDLPDVRNLGLSDTHLGMILLYTAENLSLSVWLLKGSSTRSPSSTKKRP